MDIDVRYENVLFFIKDNFYNNTVEFWIKERGIGIDYNIIQSNKGISKQETKTDEVSKGLKPFLVLPMGFARFFLIQTQKHLETLGVKTENTNQIIGKLEAKEIHLADMRNITEKLLNLLSNDKPTNDNPA